MKKFTISNTVNIESFDEIVNGLKLFLDRLCTRGGDTVLTEEIKTFCESLIDGQSGELRDGGVRLESGSWCVSPSIAGMPSDARFDYISVPTYLAVSILVKIKTCFPQIALDIPRFDDSLKAGLDFAALRTFMGHGYDAMTGLFESVEILSAGGVFNFAKNNPDISPSFCSAVSQMKTGLEARLSSGDVKEEFYPHDISDEIRRVLLQITGPERI